MKHENLLLAGLFLACTLTCSLVLGGMVSSFPATTRTLGNAAVAQTAAARCALPADGVICPRQPG
jgi:hypothetical protein